jgi:hypothetical protein
MVDSEPLGDDGRPGEGSLHRELLVEQHADQQAERVALQQRVGRWFAGDVYGHCA